MEVAAASSRPTSGKKGSVLSEFYTVIKQRLTHKRSSASSSVTEPPKNSAPDEQETFATNDPTLPPPPPPPAQSSNTIGNRKSELKTTDLFTQLRRSDLNAADILIQSEATNPFFRPSSLRASNLSASGFVLPGSFEEAVYGDFDTLLEYARSQHQEESLAFWLAVEDFRQFEKRNERDNAAAAAVEKAEKAADSTEMNNTELDASLVQVSVFEEENDNGVEHAAVEATDNEESAQIGAENDLAMELPAKPHSLANASTSSSSREEYLIQRKRKMSMRPSTALPMLASAKDLLAQAPNPLLEYAKDIFCEFLDDNADHWISLNERIARELREKMENGTITPSSFDEAQKLVFVEMKANLYPGYLKLLRSRQANFSPTTSRQVFSPPTAKKSSLLEDDFYTSLEPATFTTGNKASSSNEEEEEDSA